MVKNVSNIKHWFTILIKPYGPVICMTLWHQDGIGNVKKILAVSLALGALCAAALPASATTLNASYFKVLNNGQDPDFQSGQCCGTYSNEVKSTLGPNGLPVYNPGYGGPALQDVNSSGELTWWSPLYNSNVIATGTGVVTLPYNSSMYPNNSTGTDDSSAFETAIFSGNLSLSASGTVSFTLGADDDALLFVDGVSVAQDGGVHGFSPATVTTTTLSAGSHSLQLFYADRNTVGAQLQFSLDSSGATLSAVPLPASAPMFGAALLTLGAVGYGMKRRANASA